MTERYDLTSVPFAELDPRRLEQLIGPERLEELVAMAGRVRALLDGRRVLHLNSTANGGGVAELLLTLLGYVRALGIETEWLVIRGDAEFFAITKRIHNGLYGGQGDGLELGPAERPTYEGTLARSHDAVRRLIRPEDVVVVHDPQPAGLVPLLRELGASVVWRCHVGIDGENEWSERAWEFVQPYVEQAHAFVFSRRSFAPEWIEPARLEVIPPSIDPFTTKNVELPPERVLALLAGAGFVAAPGAPAHVRRARFVRELDPPSADARLVVQVSRWDRMKDMGGVLQAFVDGVSLDTGAHLVLAGPAVDSVDDDPEALEIWEETGAQWRKLSRENRARVHLAAVPMEDLDENALVINALQRHAAIVAQKSLAEGFGLTVAEAMWKSRPVVASAVGGIVDQIVDGETGVLVEPHDLGAFGEHLSRLLERPGEAERLGANARRRVSEHFLGDRHLLQYGTLFERLLAGADV